MGIFRHMTGSQKRTSSSYYKGTPHTWPQSTPCCLPTQFYCAASGYQKMECKGILVYIVDYSL